MARRKAGAWMPSPLGMASVSVLLTGQGLAAGRAIAQQVAADGASPLVAATLGAKLVDSLMGDLSGEGWDEALLVVDPARGDGGHALEVVLMRRDAAGRLHRAATNARLFACGPCTMPGERLRARPGSFTVIDRGQPGGTTAEYRFDYDRHAREWFIAHVSRTVGASHGQRPYRQELGSAGLGRISFAHFDPARLPPVPDAAEGLDLR